MSALPRFIFTLTAIFLLVLSHVVSGVEPEIVINIERNGDAFIVDTKFDLPVPLRTAWEVLTDFDNMTGILSNLTSSKIVRRDGKILYVAQEGLARFGILSYAFASEREIRLEPMKRILARQITGNAEGSVWVCSQRPECKGRRSGRKHQKPAKTVASNTSQSQQESVAA